MVTSLHQEKCLIALGALNLRISLLWKSFLKLWWGDAEFQTFSFPAVVSRTDWF